MQVQMRVMSADAPAETMDIRFISGTNTIPANLPARNHRRQ